MKLNLIVVLILVAPTFAQLPMGGVTFVSGTVASSITFTGSCAATGTGGCTLSASNSGDLQIAFAYRSGSTTAPGAMSGWTTVATGATSATGTTGSYRLMCRVSNTLASGSSANASDTTVLSYSGTDANATADCAYTGIAAFTTPVSGVTYAKTSTTFNYAALSLLDTAGYSYVVGFAGNSAGGLCDPSSGLTNRASAGTGPAIRSGDTATGTASWAAKTCSVTSGTWMNVMVELLAHSTVTSNFSPVQHPTNFTCTSTSCAVTTSSTTAGNVLILWSSVEYTGTGTAGVMIFSSVSDNGTSETWTHCPNSVINTSFGSTKTYALDCWYVLSAAGGATSVTANWTLTGMTGATQKVSSRLEEWHPTTTPVYYDSGNAQYVTTNCANCAGPLGLASGSSDILSQALMIPAAFEGGHTYSAISPPYTNTDQDGSNNALLSAFTGATRFGYRAPTWVQSTSGGPNFVSAATFSNNASPTPTVNLLTDFSACSNGAAPTTACAISSTQSGWGTGGDVGSVHAGLTTCTSILNSHLPFDPTSVNGLSVSGTSGIDVCGVTSTSGTNIGFYEIVLGPAGFDPPAYAPLTVGATVYSTCPANVDCGATFRVLSLTDYAVLHLSPGGNGQFTLETSNGGSGAAAGTYAPNTAYRVNILFNGTTGTTDKMTICQDGPGGSVLATLTANSANTNNGAIAMDLGLTGEEPTTSGYHYYFRNVVAGFPYSTTKCY